MKFSIPLRISGGLNSREHHMARVRRVKAERQAVALICGRHLAQWAVYPCVVTITRVGPRLLDSDNLPGSIKGVRDEVAAQFGITDGPTDARAEWRCEQRKGMYAVEIEIVSKVEQALRELGFVR